MIIASVYKSNLPWGRTFILFISCFSYIGLLLLTKEYGTSISSKSELKDQRNSQSFHHNQDNIQRKNENRKVVLVADVNEAKPHIKTSMELGLVSKEGQSITFSPMGIRERYLKRSIATERGHELVTEGAFVYPVKTKDRPLSRTPREVNSEKNGEKRRHADPPIATPFQEVPKKRGGMFVIVSEDNIVEKEIDFPNAEAPIKGRTSASDFVANADIRRTLMPTTVASGIIRNSDASQTNDKKSQETVQSVLTLAPEDSVSVLATDTILAEKWSVGTAETTAANKQDLQGNNNSTRFINPNQNKYNTYNQSVQGLRDKNDQLAEKNILSQQLKNVHKTKYSGKFTIVSQALIPDVSPPNESKTGLINYSLLMDDQPKELSNWNETNYLIFTATPQHHKVNHEQELTDVNMGKDLQSQDMDKKPIGFKTKSSEESVRTATQKGQDNDLSTDVRNNDTVYAPKIEISSKLASNLNKSSLSEKLKDGRSLVPNAAENKDLRIRSNFEPYPGTTFENSITGRTSNPTMKKYTLDPNPTLVSQMFKRTTKGGENEIQQIEDLEHDQSETKDPFADNDVIKSANAVENEIKPTSPNLPRKEQRSGSDSDSLDDKPSLYQHNLQETTTTTSLTKDRKPVSDYLPSIDRINKSAQESKSANFHDVKPPNLVQSEISSARKLLGADLENEAPIAGELLEESSQQQEFLKAKVLDDALNVSTTYSSKTSGHYSNGSDIKMSKVLPNTSLGVHAGIEGNSPQSLVDGVGTTSYIQTGFQEGFLSESSFQQQQETENSYLDPIHQKFDKPSAQEDTLNNLQSGYLSEQYLQGFYGGEKLDAPKMYDLLASHSSDDNKPKKSPLANARDSSFLLDRLHESLQYDGNALELSFNSQNPGTLNKHKMTHDSLQSRDDFGEAPGSLESTLEDNDNPHTQVKSAADKAIMMHKKKMAEELGNAFAVESEPDYVPGDVREATEGKSNVIPVAESIAEAPKKRYFSNRKNGGDISRMQNSAATTPKDVRSVKRAELLQQKSKHLPASWTKAAILQSNLPPFFWSTDTVRDVLPADYFSDASNDKSWIKSKRKYLIKPLPLNMQAALLPMTNRKLGIIPTCMMMVAFFIFLLGIGVTAIVFAQKRRFKKYTRRFVYTMILASRLREESLRKRKNKAQEVHINLETNLCPYVTLQRKYLSDEVYQNLRNAIKKVSEYQSMIDVYEKIKKTGDRQKLDTVAALLADFFRKERDESAQKAKMIKLIAEAQTN